MNDLVQFGVVFVPCLLYIALRRTKLWWLTGVFLIAGGFHALSTVKSGDSGGGGPPIISFGDPLEPLFWIGTMVLGMIYVLVGAPNRSRPSQSPVATAVADRVIDR